MDKAGLDTEVNRETRKVIDKVRAVLDEMELDGDEINDVLQNIFRSEKDMAQVDTDVLQKHLEAVLAVKAAAWAREIASMAEQIYDL